MLLESISEDEFKDIQDNFPNSNYYQSVEWSKVKELMGWTHTFIVFKNQEQYIYAAMILWKKILGNINICYAPRGILGDLNDTILLEIFTIELKKYLKKRGAVFLKIDPLIDYSVRDRDGKVIKILGDDIINNLNNLGYHHQGFTTGYGSDIQYRWSFYLDIQKDYLNNLDSRCKRCLNKANKYPLTIKDVDDTNIYEFKELMESTSIRHNSFDRSLEYYKTLKRCLKDNIFFKIVYIDRDKYLSTFIGDKNYDLIKNNHKKLIPISCGVFIKDNNAMHYVYGGNDYKYMSFMGSYRLQKYMIDYSKDKGIPIYDFGGISGNFDTNSKHYGIYEFKRGFGGSVQEYIGEFDLIINKPLYILYRVSYTLYKRIKIINSTLKR